MKIGGGRVRAGSPVWCARRIGLFSGQEIREHVRDRYAAAALAVVSGSAASCCGPSDGPRASCCGQSDALSAISDADEGDIFGAALYTPGETDGLPEEAVLASLGCGNPLAVAELRDGEWVLDLGSGGGEPKCSGGCGRLGVKPVK